MENSWFLNSCCLFSIPFDTPRGVANAYIWPSDNCHQLRHRSYMQASIAKSPPGVVTCIGPLALGNLFSFASMQLMGLLENLLKQCMGYGYEPINFIHTTLHTWLVFRFCTWPSKAPRLQCISGLADSLTCTASSVGRNAGLTACKAAWWTVSALMPSSALKLQNGCKSWEWHHMWTLWTGASQCQCSTVVL